MRMSEKEKEEKRINGEIAYKKIEEPELNYKLPGF